MERSLRNQRCNGVQPDKIMPMERNSNINQGSEQTPQGVTTQPHIVLWILLGVSVILLIVKVFEAFPLPMLLSLWGNVQMRRADQSVRKTWIAFTVLTLIVALVMILLWVTKGGLD